jgi:hypothetical protein
VAAGRAGSWLDWAGIPPSAALATGLSLGVTVVLGVWPQPLFDFAQAAKLLF